MEENKAFQFYRRFFSSKENERDEILIKSFIKNRNQQEKIFNENVIDEYINNPCFIENNIINYILDMKRIDEKITYQSLYLKQMNVATLTLEKDSVIIMDELFAYSAISFFLTVFSLAYDKSNENFECCIKNFFVLLDLQGKKHQIGVHNIDDILNMITLPENIMHLAIDLYWTSWTFLIGHELYHHINKHKVSSFQEELEADAYGYQVLIHMISKQKEGKIPNVMKVYYENTYLSPIMLFEYFKVVDIYQAMCNIQPKSTEYPSPKEREEQIFNLFDECVPENFDTEEGNEVLSIFLETLDLLQEQIILKKELGKLEI